MFSLMSHQGAMFLLANFLAQEQYHILATKHNLSSLKSGCLPYPFIKRLSSCALFCSPSLPLGLISSLLLSFLWLSPLLEQPPIPGDRLAVAMFALSALTELTAEPLWVLGQAHQYIALKVGIPSCHV